MIKVSTILTGAAIAASCIILGTDALAPGVVASMFIVAAGSANAFRPTVSNPANAQTCPTTAKTCPVPAYAPTTGPKSNAHKKMQKTPTTPARATATEPRNRRQPNRP